MLPGHHTDELRAVADLHIGHMKVSEAIRFSLVLRASPLLPDRFIDFQVRVILHLLKLTHRANSLIGSATVRGISTSTVCCPRKVIDVGWVCLSTGGGERRRLTIALEVAAGHAGMFIEHSIVRSTVTSFAFVAQSSLWTALRTVSIPIARWSWFRLQGVLPIAVAPS